MKLKYYLRGLAIGIIITTIIMLITFSGSKSSLSDAQIIERAKTLGMVIKDASSNSQNNEIPKGTETKPQTKPQTESTQPSTAQSATTNTAQSTATNTTENDTSSSTETNPVQTNPDTETNENIKQANQNSSFTVKPGDTSDSVADRLYQEGFIDNAQAFNQFIIKKGYDKKLKVGTYTIVQGEKSDYQKILDSIMK